MEVTIIDLRWRNFRLHGVRFQICGRHLPLGSYQVALLVACVQRASCYVGKAIDVMDRRYMLLIDWFVLVGRAGLAWGSLAAWAAFRSPTCGGVTSVTTGFTDR